MLLGIRWGGLRAKIIAWSFIPAAFILLAVALSAYYAYQRVTSDLVIEQNQELARLSAGQIAKEMTEYTGNLSALARTLSDYRGAPAAQRAALQQAANRLVVFDGGIVLLDNHGIVMAAQPDRPEIWLQDWSRRPYFQQMVQSPGPVFSDVVNDGLGGTPVIAVAVPVTGPVGEFLGTAIGMFRLGAPTVSSFYGSLVKLRIAPNETAYLVDRNGQVIYHTDAARIGEDFSSLSAVQQVLSGRVGALRTRDVAAHDIVASYAPVLGTPWGLVIETNWRAWLRASQGYGPFLLLLLALGVVVPAIVVAVGARRITRPINDLIDAAQQVASGHFGYTVTASTGDEVEALVEQFNRMSVELQSSYTALTDRNEQLELIMRSSNDGIWDWDLRTNQTYFSQRWKGILGYRDDEIANEFAAWRDLLHPDDVEPTLAALQAYFDGRSSAYSPEFRLRHKDGSYRWILARGTALRDADGKPYRMLGSHTDISEQKRAQAILAGQRQFLELLARGENFPEMLDALVRAIEEQSPGLMGLVRLAGAIPAWSPEDPHEMGEEGLLCCAAAPSLPAEYVRSLDSVGLGGPTDFCGAAARTGQRVIVEDIAADPRGEGLRDLALAHGLRACWTEPILSSGGRVVGTFAMYSTTPRSPTASELRTIETAARLVGIALEHQQAREAIQAAYQSLERRVEERTRELAALNAIAAVVSRSLDLQDIMSDALAKTMEVIRTDAGAAYRLEESSQELVSMADRGLSAEFVRWSARLPLAIAMAGKSVNQDHPLIWQVTEYPEGELKAQIAQEGLQTVIGVPLVATGRLVGALALSSRSPRVLTPEESSLLMAVGRQIGVAAENARLYMAEQDRRAESERRRQVAEGLRETLDLLNSRQSLADTLDHIVAQACQLLGSDAAALMRLEDKAGDPRQGKGTLVMQAAYSLPAGYMSGLKLPLGKGTAGRALAERRPVGVPDLAALEGISEIPARGMASDPDRSAHLPLEPEQSPEWQLLNEYRAFLAVPLIIRDEAYGTITLYYRQPHEFSEEEVRLATAVANQAALAIESARLREQAQQAAAIAERTRLARELHDSVTQSLYSVTLYAEAAARLLENGNQAPATDYLREVRDTAQEALREMRLLVFELRPPALEEVGLIGALQARLQAVEARGGMEAELRVDGATDADRLPLPAQAELYHIVQEALNNVLKHAHAEHVWIHLSFKDGTACAEVRDDGIGFELGQAYESGGLGISGMSERAERIGGQLAVETAPGKGTQVRVELGG